MSVFEAQFKSIEISEEQVIHLLQQMDEACLMDSPRYWEFKEAQVATFKAARVREPAHAGASYSENPADLKQVIDGFFQSPDGPGNGQRKTRSVPLRGLIAPHIDFNRGGPCFAWAYRELVEAPMPDLFIVLGTGHSATSPFVLSTKDFNTPFGTVKADQEFIGRLMKHYSSQDLLDDEFAHREEHSIEFQAVFLKYLFPDQDISFVPVLCGSFHEMVVAQESPMKVPVIAEFVEALKQSLAEDSREVCFIAGVDFSHVGARFGDEEKLSDAFIEGVERSDRELLNAAGDVDAERFFDVVIRECDRTRVCGTSSIYTMLHALEADRGKLLKYDKAVDLEAQSLVSFASMAFY